MRFIPNIITLLAFNAKKTILFFWFSLCLGFSVKAQNSLEQWDAYLKTAQFESYVYYLEYTSKINILYSLRYFEYKGDPYLVESHNGAVTNVYSKLNINLFDFIKQKKSALKKMGKRLYTPGHSFKRLQDTTSINKSMEIKYSKINQWFRVAYFTQKNRNNNKAGFEILDEIVSKMQDAIKEEKKL